MLSAALAPSGRGHAVLVAVRVVPVVRADASVRVDNDVELRSPQNFRVHDHHATFGTETFMITSACVTPLSRDQVA